VTLKPGLGVTQGHRNRHVSIRHLCSYYVLSRTVSEINDDFSLKSQNFLTPSRNILRLRWRGSSWNMVSTHGVKKLEWWGYRAASWSKQF